MLDHRQIKHKYGTLYEGIKTHHKSTAHYTSVFVWRRFIYVLVVVLLDQFVYFKIQLFLLL